MSLVATILNNLEQIFSLIAGHSTGQDWSRRQNRLMKAGDQFGECYLRLTNKTWR
jgi:hypothetical protein